MREKQVNDALTPIALSFCLLAGSTWWLTMLVRGYALKNNMLDVPVARSSHTVDTPRGGGLAIVINIIIACAILIYLNSISLESVSYLLFPALIAAAVSFVEDHRTLPKRVRISLHLLSAVALVLLTPNVLLDIGPWAVNLTGFLAPIAVVLLTWHLNLYNFMDGIDGIAACQALIVFIGMACIQIFSGQLIDPLLILSSAAILGFLAWNWAPAKIFMGDIGSCFLGVFLPACLFYMANEYQISLWSGLILLSIFIVDASWTLTVRFLSKQAWNQPHRSHSYQILSRRWNSHSRVVYAMIVLAIMWLIPLAILADVNPAWGGILFLLAALPILTACHTLGAGHNNDI